MDPVAKLAKLKSDLKDLKSLIATNKLDVQLFIEKGADISELKSFYRNLVSMKREMKAEIKKFKALVKGSEQV
jgi:hypothetical protein